MKKLILTAAAAIAYSAGLYAADIKTPGVISGCVHEGKDPDTYVLLNVKDISDGKPVPAGFVYWLSSTKELKGHVGEKVEVHGTYSVDRDLGKTAKVTVKTDSDGEQTVELENGVKKTEMKQQEPRPVGTSGVMPSKLEIEKPYRHFDVVSVRTIAARCDVP